MPFSIYQSSIPVFIRAMTNLSSILKKAEDDLQQRKIDPAVLVHARLAPDMLPFSKQIQIASDMVKNGGARLAQLDPPVFEDNETSFEELRARTAKTNDFLNTIAESQLAGAEDREITLKFPGRELRFSGADYLTFFVLPNLYFHSTTTYAILRHNGVPLGKTDFIGGV